MTERRVSLGLELDGEIVDDDDGILGTVEEMLQGAAVAFDRIVNDPALLARASVRSRGDMKLLLQALERARDARRRRR